MTLEIEIFNQYFNLTLVKNEINFGRIKFELGNLIKIRHDLHHIYFAQRVAPLQKLNYE